MFLEKPNHAKDKRERAKEKLRDWLAVRKLVLVRDLYRCRACQSKEQVDVHHLKFRSAGGKDVPSNLLVLCRVCHGETHAYRLAIVGDNAGKVLRFVRRTV